MCKSLLSIPTITVYPNEQTNRVSPDLYGVFFEEINNAGDGGLYAEMVRNRSFLDPGNETSWTAIDGATMSGSASGSMLAVAGPQGSGVANAGYWGMNFIKGEDYLCIVKASGGLGPRVVRVSLEHVDGTSIASSELKLNVKAQTVSLKLRAQASTPTGRLTLRTVSGPGFLLDYVSLFPTKTYKGRRNGLRADLAQSLNELKPAFVRFPGGCWVEGDTCSTSLRWKTTIGDVQKRRTQPNLWNYTSTNGLGFHEYLQMCEDLGSKALFVINCGMSHKDVVPMDQMDEYVQDALDAIEYANGPTNSKWGAERSKNGHPKPFNLQYLEIGNENGGIDYAKRYPLFVHAIRAKYPEINLIANVWGGTPDSAPVQIVDEHYYSTPEFFIQNADKYDSYDRSGPKVYVGEYAVTQGCGNGNLRGAIGEAAFMTGMERNSDVVVMSSYAPLFANVNAKGWNPDLIYFDSHQVWGTPSYYVQKMFANNRPDFNVRSELSNVDRPKGQFPAGGVGIGTWATQAEFKDVEILEDSTPLYTSSNAAGLKIESGTWRSTNETTTQSSVAEGSRAWIGDTSLKRYRFRCKARKLRGNEGFLITVGRTDEKNYLWWNIGGWGNTVSAIERSVHGSKSLIGKQVQLKIETGQWYDVEVDYSPDHLTCRLNGREVHSEDFPSTRSLFAVAGKTRAGVTIVKVVNTDSSATDLNLKLLGINGQPKELSVECLTSASGWDENTAATPRKVFPTALKQTLKDGLLKWTFQPQSLTIFRIKDKR